MKTLTRPQTRRSALTVAVVLPILCECLLRGLCYEPPGVAFSRLTSRSLEELKLSPWGLPSQRPPKVQGADEIRDGGTRKRADPHNETEVRGELDG